MSLIAIMTSTDLPKFSIVSVRKKLHNHSFANNVLANHFRKNQVTEKLFICSTKKSEYTLTSTITTPKRRTINTLVYMTG